MSVKPNSNSSLYPLGCFRSPKGYKRRYHHGPQPEAALDTPSRTVVSLAVAVWRRPRLARHVSHALACHASYNLCNPQWRYDVLVDEWLQNDFQTYITCQIASRKPIFFEDETVPTWSQTVGLEKLPCENQTWKGMCFQCRSTGQQPLFSRFSSCMLLFLAFFL